MKVSLDNGNCITVKMVQPSALDTLKEEYISATELASFLGMELKRIKDLISLHKKDGQFMKAYKISAGSYLFHIDDVMNYIQANSTMSETS